MSLPFLFILFFGTLAIGVARLISAGELTSSSSSSATLRSLKAVRYFPARQILSYTSSSSPSQRFTAMRTSHNKRRSNHDNDFRSFGGDNEPLKPKTADHYACPPTSIEQLRRRYGTSKSFWGEWSCSETRRFYRQQLPVSLQIDGMMGLSLEERARLAAEARHALRIYTRERCVLHGRLLAMLYDGVRHVQTFGYWRNSGMTWQEVQAKYRRRAVEMLGEGASEEEVNQLVYELIVEKACETNQIFDQAAAARLECTHEGCRLLGNAKSSSSAEGEELERIVDDIVASSPSQLQRLLDLNKPSPSMQSSSSPHQHGSLVKAKKSMKRKMRWSMTLLLRGLY